MSPSTGHFVLHTNVLPKVLAGSYELVSSISGTPFGVREERTHVHVASPRFTMPPEQVLSSYPPANAEGTFGDRLPQIVLKRRTLPWERNPFGGNEPVATPWLALVVVAEGEGELSTSTPVADCVTKPSTLDFSDRDVDQGLYLAVTQSVVNAVFPCEVDLPLLTHVREVDVNDTELANGDDDGWLAVVLANRLPVRDVASDKPVRYLACLVNLEGQLGALPPPSQPNEFFSFGLVEDWSFLAEQAVGVDQTAMGSGLGVAHVVLDQQAGAELPDPGFSKQQAALPGIGATLDGAAGHATSSKGSEWSAATTAVTAAAADPDAARIVRDTMGMGWRYPISTYAADPVLRFPVLAHWSFTTTQGAAFDELMRELDVGLIGTLAAANPSDPPHPVTTEVIETGHIELALRSRRGDTTTSWYRGAVVPHPILRDSPVAGKLPVAHAADQLRRVVPEGGEDLSLAAGFEIGRLLALSQLSIVAALLRFRGEQFGAERVRQLVNELVPFEGMVAVAGVDLSRLVSTTLLERLATEPDVTLGPQRPVADPGRPVLVRGALDEVVAGGLGLDLDVLRKTGSTIGVVAALGQTTVPVARQDVGKVDDGTIELLHESLQAKVRTIAEMALPPAIAGGPGGVLADAPNTDALDDLITGAPADADPDQNEP